MAPPKSPKGRKRKGLSRRKWITICSVIVVFALLIGLISGVRYYYNVNLRPVSNSQQAVSVTVAKGSDLNQVADLLKSNKLIRNSVVFAQYVRGQNLDDKIQAGTYSLTPSLSVPEITTILTHGNVQENLFTILPAQRLDQIKSALINAGFSEADVDAAMNPALYSGQPALADLPPGATLEGFLYPDSFQKISSTTPQTIVNQSLTEMGEKLTPDIQAGFTAQGLTVFQGVTLASIVEKEVNTQSDRNQVAQVFLSRLQQGMPLGSDVTAMYGAIQAGLSPNDLSYDSPYNTLIHTGLPPGPISNVSESSLEAVAHPASTNWLYFVSGDDGKTYFSQTLDQHNQQTQQYCHKLCS